MPWNPFRTRRRREVECRAPLRRFLRPEVEQLEDRVLLSRYYTVPGLPGEQVTVNFRAGAGDAAFHSEMGVYVVQDASGRVDGLRPSHPRYAAAAMDDAQVVFTSDARPGTRREFTFTAGTKLGFYLVQNSTSAAWRAHNPQNDPTQGPIVLFAPPAANADGLAHVRGPSTWRFAWEDMVHGDRDFDDMIFTVGVRPTTGGGDRPRPRPGFDDALTGWTAGQMGGSPDARGSVIGNSGDAVFREGDSFAVTLQQTFTVPAGPSQLAITFALPAFDTTGTGSIPDAFEAALVDGAGNPLAFTFVAGADAFFSLSEGLLPALAPGVTLNGQTVTVSLAGRPAGSSATLILRLLNNDGDTNSSVRINSVEVQPGGTPPPAGVVSAAAAAAAGPSVIDFAPLSDVTASLVADTQRPSFNQATQVLSTDLVVRNPGSFPVDGPLLVGITNLSDPSVRVRDPDGFTPDGVPFFDLTELLANGTLQPGEATGPQRVEFFNPGGEQFTFDFVFLGQLNRAPAFMTSPNVQALVDQPYTYPAAARDPDDDPLTFSLVMSPVGMTVNPATGLIAWTPTAGDRGNHVVTLRVEDGRGGSAEQPFTLAVVDAPPNRPPRFTSTPVVDGTVNAGYSYQAAATDADGDALTFLLISGPAGLSIAPMSGLVTWTPTAQQLGTHNVALQVADTRGGTATQLFAIGVAAAAGNSPPVIVSDPVTQFPVEVPGTATGDVTPNQINLGTSEQRVQQVSVRVPAVSAPARIDLTPTSVDTNALTTDAAALAVAGTLRVQVQNRGADDFRTTTAGAFDVLAFEDRNGNLMFDPGIDNELGTERFIGTILSGASVNVDVPVSGILQYLDRPIAAFVDSETLIAEVDETNNMAASGLDSLYQPPAADWLPVVKFRYDAPPDGTNVNHPPIVAPLIDTNGDGRINERDVPALIFVTANLFGGNRLVALRGDTGQEIFTTAAWNVGSGNSTFVTPVVGDLEGDGTPEIVVNVGSPASFSPLGCFDNAGVLQWVSSPIRAGYALINLADLDGDGMSEIMAGTTVLNFDGTRRWDSVFTVPPGQSTDYRGGSTYVPMRQVADLNMDGTPEIVAGPSVLDNQGRTLWKWQGGFDPQTNDTVAQFSPTGRDQDLIAQFRTPYSFTDGFTAVANLDDDPFPEIVFLSSPSPAPTIWVFNHDGTLKASPFAPVVGVPNVSSAEFGPPVVADFDGDGQPEIGVLINRMRGFASSFDDPSRPIVAVVGLNGSTLTTEWLKDITPSDLGGAVQVPALSAFDFDGDGASELVYRSKQTLSILNGSDGTTLFEMGLSNSANDFQDSTPPVVADVDNDGNAEILAAVSGAQFASTVTAPFQGFVVLGDANGNWVHARRVWNQFQYNVTNVDEDAGIPAVARNSWEVHNSQREQVPIEGLDPFAAPDLSVSLITVDTTNCPAGAITARIGNGGSLQVGSGVPVNFYLGDPAAGGARIATARTTRVLFPGDFEDVTVPWAATSAGQLFVTVNETPNPSPTPSSNLSLLPYTWAEGSGRNDSATQANFGVYNAIDGNTGSRWERISVGNVDPRPEFYVVHFPFPVNVNSVTILNQGANNSGFHGTGTLTFSNGFNTTLDLGTTGAGSTTFAEQQNVSWVRLTSSVAAPNRASLSEFIVGGSYVQPPFLIREGTGRLGNNITSLFLATDPCDGDALPPTVEVGPDRTIFAGDTLSLNPATFTDPGVLSTHTATIDWNNGPAEPGTVNELDGAGTVSGSHLYSAEGTYTVSVTVRDAAGNMDTDTFTLRVLNPSLRDVIDVVASDPSVNFVNLTGPLAGVAPNQLATFDVRITGNAAPHRFELQFVQTNTGRLLGSIPVTVNEVYQYPVRAIDADNDPITYRLLQGPTGSAINAAGLISWLPSGPGAYPFSVEASDNRGGMTTQTYNLVASTAANQNPVITSTTPQRALVFRDFSYPVTATDPDGERLAYFLTTAPAGMTIDSVTGRISWRPTATQVGIHPVTVTVRDPRGGQASQPFNLEATADSANRAPAFTSTPPTFADPGVLLSYPATATDADNDPVQFDLPLRPAGMTIDGATGQVLWRAGAGQVGVHDVIVRARDGLGGVTLQPFQVTVRELNTSPFITSSPPTQAVRNLPYQYAVRAQDTPGDVLAFRLDAAPAGMVIDPATGVIRWTPADAQVGVNPVSVTVTDGRGGEASQAFDVTVVAAAVNDPPVIRSDPRTITALGNRYVYRVDAFDPNADPLTFRLTTFPAGMTIDAAGLVAWEPTPAQLGPNAVEVQVDDGRGGVATRPFDILVVGQTVRNQAPVINSTPSAAAVVGRPYAYDVQATDADNDPLVFSLATAPRGMSIDADLGTIRWQPTSAQLGTHDVVVQVMDAQGSIASQRFQVTVRTVNTPPLITSTPPTEAAVGTLSTYQVRAQDRDGDRLRFTLITAPAGMTIDAVTGLVQWTPTGAQVGLQDVEVVVDDFTGGTASQRYRMVVAATPANQPPALTSTPSLAGTMGVGYAYQATATDPEAQPVTFLLLQNPAGMTIDAATGQVAWVPTFAQVGSNAVIVAARDASGSTAQQRFTVQVTENNSPPRITSAPPLTATAGDTYSYDLRATDPDGDFLRYVLEQGPAGMTLDMGATNGQTFSGVSGRLRWVPTFADAGVHPVRVRVLDPRGLSDVQTFDVTVAGDTQAPRVSLSIDPNPVNIGSQVTVVVTATDNVGVIGVQLTIGGTIVPLDPNGRATVPMNTLGAFDVAATAVDAAGNQAPATTATLLVRDPTVAGAPTVAITSPVADAMITAPVDVIGTATDPDFAFYVLEVAPFGGGMAREVARGTTPVVNGVLGRFDPSLLANDSYILRLTATDTGGNTATTERMVSVAGNLKLGNFTLSFADMAASVSGIPIQVSRTYDTLNANVADDLGFGWRLEFRDVRLRTSVPPTGLENDGFFNGFRDGTRVYVTLPGGKREGFTFRPRAQFFLASRFFHPSFEPDPGVTSRLVVNDFMLRERDGEYVEVSRAIPYNPADPLFGGGYTMVTREGTSYQIEASQGQLIGVRDPNGNTLAFTDGGIISSAGPQITFERDPQERIVSIIDPTGNAVRYQYDVAGDLNAVTDRMGNTTRFVYRTNPAHYLEQLIDPLDRPGIRIEYDAQGKMVRQLNGAGNALTFIHDLGNSRETVLDARGNSTTYEYDQRGNVLAETNALGAVVRWTYDANDNVLAQTDALGNTIRFTYDAFRNVLTQSDPLGNVNQFTYVQNASLLTVTDPLGNGRRYGYDGNGLLLTNTNQAGSITTAGYDSLRNLTSFTTADGARDTFEHDSFANVIRYTDPLGNTTDFTYDANGRELTQSVRVTSGAVSRRLVTTRAYDANGKLTSITDPAGNVNRHEYDALGKQTAIIDALGRRTEFRYDGAGRLVEKQYPDGTSESFRYDPAGNKIEEVDRAGRVTRFEYDMVNQLVTTVYPDDTPGDLTDNPRRRTEYDIAGQIRAQIDERGNRTTFDYDAAGRQTAIRDALGNVSTKIYDGAGHVITEVDALGRATRFLYNDLNRLIETVFADGSSSRTTHDLVGRVVARTDQAGVTTRYEYDAGGQLIGVVDALGQRSSSGYDGLGRLVRQTDADGRLTGFEYDDVGRLTATILPLGQRSATTYDAAGNVTSTTDFVGNTIRYAYDGLNRLSARRLPDGTSVQFTYTPTGQRQTVQDTRGVTTYAYDQRDRLISRTEPDGRSIQYTYDLAGNQTSVATPAGATFYAYDALNRLSTVTDPGLGVTRYTFDAVNNLIGTELVNGTAETRTYNELNRLVFLQSTGPGGVISSYRYTLTPTGRRTTVEEDSGRRVQYTYDVLYRLVQESITDPVAGDRSIRYAYDSVSNRLSRDDSVAGLTVYQYDENDRLLTETLAGEVTRYTYDANGNTRSRVRTAADQAIYEWDVENRLRTVDFTDVTGTRRTSFQYDADGLRVSSVVDGNETRYLLDTTTRFAQVLEEYTPNGANVAAYVYGLGLLSQIRGGTQSFYHADGLGSTRVLTGATGVVTDRYSYDAFGSTLSQTGTTANLYLFAGEQRDPNVGLDYLRARYYNSDHGRFTSVDPETGDPNEPVTLHDYLYANADPVDITDPSGRFSLIEIQYANAIRLELTDIQLSIADAFIGGLTEQEQEDFAYVSLLQLFGAKIYASVARTVISAAKRAIQRGGWLIRHEGVNGGHTFRKHFDIPDDFLKDRLKNTLPHNVPAASTFLSHELERAESAILRLIVTPSNKRTIRTWATNGSGRPLTLTLRLPAGQPLGRVATRAGNGNYNVAPGTGLSVVLVKDPLGGGRWNILSAFPTP